MAGIKIQREANYYPLIGTAAFILILTFVATTGLPGSLGNAIKTQLTSSVLLLISIQMICGTIAIFALEHFFPARRDERGFSPTVALDAIYMFVQQPVVAAILVAGTAPLNVAMSNHLGWLTIEGSPNWPQPLVVLLALVVVDFFSWCSHIALHKVPLFWRFHSIHHSQSRLSMFTANRAHPLDTIIGHFIRTLPLFILFPTVVNHAYSLFAFHLFLGWHIRFQHANIGSNLGPIRYIFVTPQSHRIHHSADPDHWETNYSNIFCWDRIFGTQHKDTTSYPNTGLDDSTFPEPASVSPTELGKSLARQFLYPFEKKSVFGDHR